MEKTKNKRSWTKTLLSFAKPCRWKMIFSVIFSIISVLCGFVPFYGVYRILAIFIEDTATASEIWLWAGISLAGFAGKLLFFGISTVFSHISAYTILEKIRHKIADKLMHAPLGTVQSKTIGELKNVLVDRVEDVEPPLAHIIPEASGNLILPLLIYVVLAIIDWRMALAALVTLPVAVVPFLFLLKAFNRKYADYMASNNHVNSVIVEYVEGIEVVKAFNQTTSSYEKFSKAVKSFRDYTLDWYRSTWLPMNLILAILPTTLLGTLPVGLALYATGSLSVVNLCMCLILSLSIVASLLKLQGFINEIKSVQYNIENIESYLELPELSDSGKRIKLINFEIDFNNVHFSYSGDRKDEVLHGIDLKLSEGSFTALVGPSGGGKSTVAKLIARFWDVNEGEIKIGGHNVKELSLKQLADTVSFVTQDNFLFNCSLKENIRLGNPNASDAEVYAAAKAACCEEFILRLENGYDTSAGDAGKKLSGGEKQRIAIARAILKNAPIVILDEATAFTDPENEDKIQQSIMALTKGKTLLVIAHRLSTIQNAHQIVVLKEGNVEATGTQAELLEHCALYRDMWSAHIGAKNWAVSQ